MDHCPADGTTTRRELLARSGIAVAALYATPVVTVLTMTPAHAQQASALPPTAVRGVTQDRPGAAGPGQGGSAPVPDQSGSAPVPAQRGSGSGRVAAAGTEASSLPFTGEDHVTPVVVATALVAAGAAATAAARKRDARPQGPGGQGPGPQPT